MGNEQRFAPSSNSGPFCGAGSTKLLRPTPPVVLVVDDERVITDSVAAILGTTGITVLRAYDGNSGLEQALTYLPELVITDVAMPGMNGITLAMEIARALPACQVALFSGHVSPADLVDAHRAGFDFPILSKPMHPLALLRYVTDALRGTSAPN